MSKPLANGFKLAKKLVHLSIPYLQTLSRQIFRARFFFCIFLGLLILLLSEAIRDATGDIQR